MATVTGLTADRMLAIEGASVVDGEVVAGDLILTKHDGTTINAGNVIGPAGPVGPVGFGPIPGELKLWSGDVLPDAALYGYWTWANGDIFDELVYPLAAANIAAVWKTAHGLSDPGAGKFRVPDMRGFIPAGLDAMPGGAARANRVTRAEAIGIAKSTGEERHIIVVTEMPSHTHAFSGAPMPAHGHGASFAGNGASTSGAGIGRVFNATAALNTGSQTQTFQGPTNALMDNAHTHSFTPSGSVSVSGASAGTPAGSNAAMGGNGAHENMQPTVFVPYIVKLDD